ncbi:MAG: hypothetical protein INR73_14065 [Williamsia sp.]|nr:hypothetical protein [Williamsia sp.]
MKKPFLLISSSLYCLLLFAQQPETPLPEVAWKITEMGRYQIDSYDNGEAFERSIVYLSASEAVAAVHYAKEDGVIRIDENGQVAWECRVPGQMMGLGKMGDRIMAFYEPKGSIGQIHGVGIDVLDGKKLFDKIVYESMENTYDAIAFLNRPSGTFNNLLVRTTPGKWKRSIFNGGPSFQERASSASCKAIFFDQELAAVKNLEIKVEENYRFLGAVANEEGAIYFSNKADDEMIVEEWNAGSGATGKLHVPLLVRRNSGLTPVFSIDPLNGRNLLSAMSYYSSDKDLVFQVYQFDFKAKKAHSSTPQLKDKAFAKSVEVIVAKDKEVYKENLSSVIESLSPVKIMRIAGKIAVIRETKNTYFNNNGTRNGPTHYMNGPAVVSFLDNGLKPLKDLAINKQFEVFLDAGRTLGAHAQDRKLYVVGNSLTGIAAYSNVLCVINTETMTSETYEIVRKLTLGTSIFAEPNATLWFNKGFLLNQVIKDGTLHVTNVHTQLQKVVF